MVMLTKKITHFTFHRNCFHGITLAWPYWDHWDNPPKVGLETISLNHQPKKGFMAGPIHLSTASQCQRTSSQTLSGSFIYLFNFFWKHFNSYRMFYILQ